MLFGDWLFGVFATITVVFFAQGLYREHRRGITGIRPDISRRRTKVGMGCTVATTIGFAIWGVLWLFSDEIFTGRSGVFRGIQVHNRTMGLFALALAVLFGYIASRFGDHLGRAPVDAESATDGIEAELAEPKRATPEWKRPTLVKARKEWRAHRKTPDFAGLAHAVRIAAEAGWGVPLAHASIQDLRDALEEKHAAQAGELAAGLLNDLDAARFGGAAVEIADLTERFEELARLAEIVR